MQHVITSTWNGKAVPQKHWVFINFSRGEKTLDITVDSPFYNNAKPGMPVGPADGLWEYEVVEFFLLGKGNRYLEVELNPHGHHHVLMLNGRRNVVDRMLPIEYTARITGFRWQGVARVPVTYLPEEAHTGNAYAIYNQSEKRIHLALYPLGGDAPDFHRLEDFGPLLADYA